MCSRARALRSRPVIRPRSQRPRRRSSPGRSVRRKAERRPIVGMTLSSLRGDGVFEGGFVKGIAFVGALQAFEEVRYRWQNVPGTSARAVASAMGAAGYTASREFLEGWRREQYVAELMQQVG